MNILSLNELSSKQSVEKKLSDISNNLMLAVALASGNANGKKFKSFYKVIAMELKEIIDSGLLNNVSLYKFKNQYMRVTTENTSVCFLKNNIINNECKIPFNSFLEQKLVYLEDHELPKHLTTKEKNELINLVDDDLEEIIIRNYNRQELNSDRYMLTLNEKDKEILLRIFRRYNYYDINVRKYINVMSNDYDYDLTEFENKLLKTTYNNYILELGVYISKEIKNYLNNR